MKKSHSSPGHDETEPQHGSSCRSEALPLVVQKIRQPWYKYLAAASKSSSLKKAKSRSMLYERLEDRVLFDAVPDAALVDADAEEPLNVDQANAARFDASLYAEDVKVVADPSAVQNDNDSHVADVRRELVIVDTSVENYQQLVDDLLMNAETDRELEIALIDGDTDGISQVSSILVQHSDLDALHILSHGDETGVRFGDVWLTQSNLGGYAAEIAQWGRALTESGDLLLLERRFNLRDLVGMRLRRFNAGSLTPGAELKGELLMEADYGYQIDNMEALDIHTGPDGQAILTLLSDNNRSLLQRTLLLRFSLPPQ